MEYPVIRPAILEPCTRAVLVSVLVLLAASAPADDGPHVREVSKVLASNADLGDRFGQSVAVYENTMIVAAENEASDSDEIDGDQDDNSAADAGAVYVYEFDGSDWSQTAYLKASNSDGSSDILFRGDNFGYAVDIHGNTAVVGAPGERSLARGVNGDQEDNSAMNAGAAYVFYRQDGIWTQQAYLKASNTDAGDGFGHSVAIHGDTIVVGAIGESSSAKGVDGDEDDNSEDHAGAVYVFVRENGSWKQQAYLKASNAEAGDYFGESVSIDGDEIIVGADWEDSDATGVDGDQGNALDGANSGAAYLFVREAGVWRQQAYLKASNTGGSPSFITQGDGFGASVDIDGDLLAVGAPGEDSFATGINGDEFDDGDTQYKNGIGAVYVFARHGETWRQEAYVKASHYLRVNAFGHSLSLFENSLLVGTPFEGNPGQGVDPDIEGGIENDSGAAFLFEREEDRWRQVAYIKASDSRRSVSFGYSVAASEDWYASGALGEAGATYIFRPRLQINPGLNDAWYSVATAGQGFFIIVYPDSGIIFLAWFTFDTERPPQDVMALLGEPGHRWLTAQGPFEGDTAALDVYQTGGGVFDSVAPKPQISGPIGTISIVWQDCENATLSYDIEPPGVMGQIELTRIVRDRVALCEALNE